MRAIRLFLIFILVASSGTALAAELADQAWIEAKSPNFTIVSNAGQKQAQQTALRLEQFRAAFQKAFPNFRLSTAEPTLVFALKDEKTMKELVPQWWELPNGMRPAGLFYSGWENNLAILREDLGQQSFQVVDHEYVHELEHLNFVALPKWLSEGMAEFFSTAEFSDQEVKLGMPSRRLDHLRHQPSPKIPLLDLLKERGIRVAKDQSFASDFYAESWALTHMLILGPGMGSGAKMDDFIQRLSKEPDPVKAFEGSFGKLSDVYSRLDNYIRGNAINAWGLKNPPKVETLGITSRQLNSGETVTYFAQLERKQGRRKEAGAWLQEALNQPTQVGATHRINGFLLFQEGQDDQAEAEFSKAVELDAKDYLAKYFLAMMKYGDLKTDSDASQLIQALKEVRARNASFAPVHVEVARTYVRIGQLDMALRAAQYAAQLEPGRAGYHANVARIMLLKGDAAGAAEIARFVADRWVGTDRDQAIEIWQKAVAKDKSLGSPALDVGSDGPEGSNLRGTIVSAQCADREKKQPLGLSVRDGEDKLISLYLRQPLRMGFEDTLWYGSDHFNLCRHVDGRRVDAIYKATGENEGTLLQVRIEDELPPVMTAPKAVGQ